MAQWLFVRLQIMIYDIFVESRFLTPVTICDRIYAGKSEGLLLPHVVCKGFFFFAIACLRKKIWFQIWI